MSEQYLSHEQQFQYWAEDRDNLRAQLAESERLRTEAFAACEAMRQQVAELQRQSQIAQCTIDEWRDAWGRATGVAEQHKRQVSDLQAQLEAAAVTPSQQPDGTAERLEAVRRMIGEIWGWYACVGRLDEIKWAEAWEQVGALLGHLQREAG